MKENMVYMTTSLKNTVEALGNDEINVMVNLLNDLNKENVLLTIINNIVFYDALD